MKTPNRVAFAAWEDDTPLLFPTAGRRGDGTVDYWDPGVVASLREHTAEPAEVLAAQLVSETIEALARAHYRGAPAPELLLDVIDAALRGSARGEEAELGVWFVRGLAELLVMLGRDRLTEKVEELSLTQQFADTMDDER